MAERFILHIDMEGLLTALELRANPSLEGRWLVIGGMPDEPGIVVAHSRELRRAGIRPGMPLTEAAEIAPRAIFLPSRQRIYAEAHERVLRQLLAVYPQAAGDDHAELAVAGSPELERLVGVAQAVLSQEATAR